MQWLQGIAPEAVNSTPTIKQCFSSGTSCSLDSSREFYLFGRNILRNYDLVFVTRLGLTSNTF